MGGIASKKGRKHSRIEKCDNNSYSRRKQNFNLKNGNKRNGKNDIRSSSETLVDDTLITETEKQELFSLGTDKNISMDFILEMKEAFLFVDKVKRNILYRVVSLKLADKCIIGPKVMQFQF